MVRIRGEIPEFKRCCMCLPLRHGLIVWGYIRLILGVFVLVRITENFFELLDISKNKPGYTLHVVLFGLFVIVGGADIVLNVVFVYAGHKKYQQLLKAYYIYSFTLWIFMTILIVSLFMYSNIYRFSLYPIRFKDIWFILSDIFTIMGLIGIQVYVILLVRSEFMKLTRDCEFRFVNNAAESVCMINYEENNMINGDIMVDETKTVKKDVIDNTNSIADGNITANKNFIPNGVIGADEN